MTGRQQHKQRILNVIDYVYANSAKTPNIEEGAAVACFSRFHFQRIFKANVGISFGEFVKQVRLQKSQELLLSQPAQSITNIAMALGFSSTQNFAKQFRTVFGHSPSEVRKQGTYVLPLGMQGNIYSIAGNVRDGVNPYTLSSESGNAVVEQANMVIVKEFQPIRVACETCVGSYDGPGIRAAFNRLYRWADTHRLYDAMYLGIPWDDQNEVEKEACRYDACVVIEPDLVIDQQILTRTIAAGSYATLRYVVDNNDFGQLWRSMLLGWLPDSGYQAADYPAYEVYFDEENPSRPDEWDVELRLPVTRTR